MAESGGPPVEINASSAQHAQVVVVQHFETGGGAAKQRASPKSMALLLMDRCSLHDVLRFQEQLLLKSMVGGPMLITIHGFILQRAVILTGPTTSGADHRPVSASLSDVIAPRSLSEFIKQASTAGDDERGN